MKVFYDSKKLDPPSDFNEWEGNLWRISMLAAISAYIEPKIWDQVRERTTIGWRKAREESNKCA